MSDCEISDETVEAGAKALFDKTEEDDVLEGRPRPVESWEYIHETAKDYWRRYSRAVLTAVLPSALRAAKIEGLREAREIAAVKNGAYHKEEWAFEHMIEAIDARMSALESPSITKKE